MKLTIKSILLILAAALVSLPAHAHRAWILPGATVLSSDDAWVTFDAAISNDIFHTDYHAMGLDNVHVTGPNGNAVKLQNTHSGQYRSTFDLNLKERGTYKIASVSNGLFASWEEAGERKRWRGSVEQLASEVPEGASLTEFSRRMETFVTAGAPTREVFQSSGQGLELVPETHPNDLFAGEAAQFQLLIDGEPAVGAEVEVIPGGMRYRNQQNTIELTSDKNGKIVVDWPAAGVYWLGASYEDEKGKIKGASRRAGYMATFEVLPL